MTPSENMERLIDAVRNGLPAPGGTTYGFDMGKWYPDEGCGSACCIGGHAEILFNQPSIPGLADEIGVDHLEWRSLCFPDRVYDADGDIIDDPYTATVAQGVRALEILRDTGRTNWLRAMREAA